MGGQETGSLDMLGELQKGLPAEGWDQGREISNHKTWLPICCWNFCSYNKNPNSPSLSLSSLSYCKIRFQEMLKHLQPSAKELRLFT